MCVRVCLCVCLCERECACMSACLCVCLCAHLRACTCACVHSGRLCVYMCMRVSGQPPGLCAGLGGGHCVCGSGLGLGKGQGCQDQKGLTVPMGKLRPGERLGLVQNQPISRWHLGTRAQGLAVHLQSHPAWLSCAVADNVGRQSVLNRHLACDLLSKHGQEVVLSVPCTDGETEATGPTSRRRSWCTEMSESRACPPL